MSINTTDSEPYEYYIKDLTYIPSEPECMQKKPKWMKKYAREIIESPIFAFIKPTLEYIDFIIDMICHILLSIMTNLTIPFSQPFNLMFMVMTFPIVILVLFPMNIVLKIYKFFPQHFPGRKDHFNKEDWEKMVANGSTIEKIVQNGQTALGLPVCKINQPKIFDFDMAETLLILSTIIYEQDTKKSRKIYRDLKKIKKLDNDSYLRLAADCREAHHNISKAIENVGLNMQYLPVSELDSLDSLFSGMFWSVENNFIVMTFKGTTATNFTEWLVDFLYFRMDANQYVFGEIHKGFYNNFFPKNSDNVKKSYPAQRILEAICQKAKEIYKINNKNEDIVDDNDDYIYKGVPVNIWITGHSLGAALAQVFYARLIKTNDFPGYCILRDAFVFAGPAVGDKEFASAFNSTLNSKQNEHRTLWRIVNTNDIVTRMPPQHLYNKFRQYIIKNDILNYFSIGCEIQFFLNKDKRPNGIVYHKKGKKDSNWEHNEKSIRDVLKRQISEEQNIIEPIINELKDNNNTFLPSFIRNHFSDRYFMTMERWRIEGAVPVVGDL